MKNKKNWLLALGLASCFVLSCSSDTAKDETDENDASETKCQTSSDCTDPDRPICSAEGECVADTMKEECRSNADCTNEEKPECSPLGTCIPKGFVLECTKNSECLNPKKPECSAVGTCVPEGTKLRCSRDADCRIKPNVVCSPVGTCVEPNTKLECTKDSDCGDDSTIVCSLKGTCEKSVTKCAEDSDCDEGYICKDKICVQERICDMEDSDGDTIADVYEGRNMEDDAKSLDTDGDTIPDYRDSDSDGDTIPDSVEGGTGGCSGAEPVDSDGDTVPDFQDKDSDDNGIPDMYEGCPMPDFVYRGEDSPKKDKKNPDHICKTPVDTSGDGIPDFQNLDNDGDGVPDHEEIMGVFATAEDRENGTFGGDCNGDGKHDPLGNASSPIDCDGDTVPDYMDADSDGDTIPDTVESRSRVTDLLARYSKDADGDTLPDSFEGCHNPDLNIKDGEWPTPDKNNPAHICNTPVDTDKDNIPDYLDLDSDGDGLSDDFEFTRLSEGYDPYKADSDDDGANDLVEFGAGTKPGDPKDNPQSRGNFVFITPYQEEANPKRETLSFDTGIQTVDVYFSIDSSVSMEKSVTTLRDKLPNMLNSLKCPDLGRDCIETIDCRDLNNGDAICSQKNRCIVSPQVGTDGKGCFADMWTGLGSWGDLNTFTNKSSISEGAQNTVTALNNFQYDKQGDKENNIQPSICAIDGPSAGCRNASCYSGSDHRFGCVGFREDAIKIYVQAGDEGNFNETGWKTADAQKWGAKLKDAKVTYVGLFGVKLDFIPDYYQWWKNQALINGIAQMACYSGSCQSGTCSENCQNPSKAELEKIYVSPLVQKNIDTVTRDMLLKIAHDKEIQITTEVVDLDPNASKLVDRLEVNISGETVQNRICTPIDASKIVSAQYPTINGIRPSSTLCFDVIPVDNQEVIEPLSEPKVYRARINVMGDGSVLNSGVAYFLVPSKISQEVVN